MVRIMDAIQDERGILNEKKKVLYINETTLVEDFFSEDVLREGERVKKRLKGEGKRER